MIYIFSLDLYDFSEKSICKHICISTTVVRVINSYKRLIDLDNYNCREIYFAMDLYSSQTVIKTWSSYWVL